ncbi:MAG: ribonuclease protein component [Desulfovibrionales bacterium]|jgi:ribonuclease P protein component|nr:ribonuclease protein component [Desulfovibrionales bacterium]
MPLPGRLTRRTEYTACYEQGKKYFTRSFVIFALRRHCTITQSAGLRVGLTVSRKTGSAVKRNRVKRVLREFFRLYGARLNAPLDLVVVPKRTLDPKRISLEMVTREFLPLFHRVQAEYAPDHTCSDALS